MDTNLTMLPLTPLLRREALAGFVARHAPAHRMLATSVLRHPFGRRAIHGAMAEYLAGAIKTGGVRGLTGEVAAYHRSTALAQPALSTRVSELGNACDCMLRETENSPHEGEQAAALKLALSPTHYPEALEHMMLARYEAGEFEAAAMPEQLKVEVEALMGHLQRYLQWLPHDPRRMEAGKLARLAYAVCDWWERPVAANENTPERG